MNTPPTKQSCLDALEGLRSLEPDWDSYGARPISDHAIEAAARYINALAKGGPGRRFPHVAPTGSGGVLLEWIVPNMDAELEFCPDGSSLFAAWPRNDAGQIDLRDGVCFESPAP